MHLELVLHFLCDISLGFITGNVLMCSLPDCSCFYSECLDMLRPNLCPLNVSFILLINSLRHVNRP